MTESVRPLQRLLALDKFGASLRDRIYEAGRIIRLDIDSGLPLKPYRNELHEWVLRWILDKLQKGADSARSEELSWRLVRLLVKALPNDVTAHAFKSARLLETISASLSGLFPEATLPKSARHPQSVRATRDEAIGLSTGQKRKRGQDDVDVATTSRQQILEEVFAITKHVLEDGRTSYRHVLAVPANELHSLLQHWLRAITHSCTADNLHARPESDFSLEANISLVRRIWQRPYPLWNDRTHHKQAVNLFGPDLLMLAAHLDDPVLRSGSADPSLSSRRSSAPSSNLRRNMIDTEILEPIFQDFISDAAIVGENNALKNSQERLAFVGQFFGRTILAISNFRQQSQLGSVLTMLMELSASRVVSQPLKLKRIQSRFVQALFDIFTSVLSDSAGDVSADIRKHYLLALFDGLHGHPGLVDISALTGLVKGYSPNEQLPFVEIQSDGGQLSFNDSKLLAYLVEHQPTMFNVNAASNPVSTQALLNLITLQDSHHGLPESPLDNAEAIVLPFIIAQRRTRNNDFFSHWYNSILQGKDAPHSRSLWRSCRVRQALSQLLDEKLDPLQAHDLFMEVQTSLLEGYTSKDSKTASDTSGERTLLVIVLLVDLVRSDSMIAALNGTFTQILQSLHTYATKITKSRAARAYYWEALTSIHERILAGLSAEGFSERRVSLLVDWLDSEESIVGNALDLVRAKCHKAETAPQGTGLEAALSYVLHMHELSLGSPHAAPILRSIQATLVGDPSESWSETTLFRVARPHSSLVKCPAALARALETAPGLVRTFGRDFKHDLLLALVQTTGNAADRPLFFEVYSNMMENASFNFVQQINDSLLKYWASSVKSANAEVVVQMISEHWQFWKRTSSKDISLLLTYLIKAPDSWTTNSRQIRSALSSASNMAQVASTRAESQRDLVQLLHVIVNAVDSLKGVNEDQDVLRAIDAACHDLFSNLSADRLPSIEKIFRGWQSSPEASIPKATIRLNLNFAIAASGASGMPVSISDIVARALDAQKEQRRNHSADLNNSRTSSITEILGEIPEHLWVDKTSFTSTPSLVDVLPEFGESLRSFGQESERDRNSSIAALPLKLTLSECMALFDLSLHPKLRSALQQLVSRTAAQLLLAEQMKLAESAVRSCDARHSTSTLVVASLVIAEMRKFDGADIEVLQLGRVLLPRLASILSSTTSSSVCYAVLHSIDLILREKRHLVSQFGIEELLGSLLAITHSSSALKTKTNSHTLYTRLCTSTQLVIRFHRHNLRGRHHLLIPLLTQLHACLFRPNDQRRSKLEFAHPPWLDAENNALGPKHAARFARLVTLLCNPPPSTVIHYSRRNNRRRPSKETAQSGSGGAPSLTDEVRAARVDAAAHVARLLSSHCHLQLHGRLADGAREALAPALYAIFDVLRLAAPDREDGEDVRVRVLGASMGKEALALLRREHGEWKRFGLWRG